jgi:hypothetical protein
VISYSEITSVEILDNGKVLDKISDLLFKKSINVSKLKYGLYSVRIFYHDGFIVKKSSLRNKLKSLKKSGYRSSITAFFFFIIDI